MNKIFIDNTSFKNKDGAEVILYGVNFVNKGEMKRGKRDYSKQLNEKLILKFKAAGFNCIRLGLIWDAIEPEPGKYDEEYLDKMVEVGKLCEKHGIYFFLDMHQDLYGSDSKVGDGAPGWAALTGGHEFHKPLFVWAEGYFFGKATNNAFTAFWNNEKVNGKGLQDYYADMWRRVCERFKDNTALVGYDLMNEPFPGKTKHDIFTEIIESAVKKAEEISERPNKKPMELTKCFDNVSERKGFKKLIFKTALRIGTIKKATAVLEVLADTEMFRDVVCSVQEDIEIFDKEYYTPFVDKMTKSIREIDKESAIFMENSYWSNLGIPYSAEKPNDSKIVFAPHGYDLFVDTPLYKFSDPTRALSIFEEHARSQERLGVPVLVGEWGAFPDKGVARECADALLPFFDENKWSSTYWCYYKGFLSSKVMDSLKRPHPQTVYGKILQYEYKKEKGVFSLCFEKRADDLDEPSIVYLPYEPKAIKTDCRTEIEKNPKGKDCILKIYPENGAHIVKVYF